MSQVITDAFASYWQQCLVDETPVELDEFVLAYVPGLDPGAPIDPASGLPLPEQIVHRHPVDQRGRINNDAVAYSIVMDTTVGDFTFNAMYLINSAQNLVGMIVHKGDETKLKTDPANGQTGNSLVKSMLMEYDRAAEASETVIDASTWQIDYAARLRGMDEDLRRQALGTFGQAAFYGDGFKLVNASGLYKVQPGQGYVGGLLVELTSEQEVTPIAKPVGLWLDVYRAGTLLSRWVNHLTLTLSAADLVDYVDANGYPHFVTKLAVINADDSVTDTRARRTLTLTGDVTGEASFNSPDSIQLEVAIKDNSHAHAIENVAGLAEALEGKAETDHSHNADDVGAMPKAGGAFNPGAKVTFSGSFNGPDDVALHMGNQSIGGVHGITFADSSGSPDEALLWPKTGITSADPDVGDYDSFRVIDGVVYINANKMYHQGFEQPGTVATPIEIAANVDLNTMLTKGLFIQSRTEEALVELNYPSNIAGELRVGGIVGTEGQYCQHTYKAHMDAREWVRSTKDGGVTWTLWVMYYSEAFKPTAADVEALPLDGGVPMTGGIVLDTEIGAYGTLHTGDFFPNIQDWWVPYSNSVSAPITYSLFSPIERNYYLSKDEGGAAAWEGFWSRGILNGQGGNGPASYCLVHTLNNGTQDVVFSFEGGGNLGLPGQPSAPYHATNRGYVDAKTWSAAAGNSDIVAGYTNPVGAYLLAQCVGMDGLTQGILVAGSNLRAAAMDVGNWDSATTGQPGTWMLQGHNDSGRDMMSLYVRQNDPSLRIGARITEIHWGDEAHTYIDMVVDGVPFTASSVDPGANGRWLFAMARDGEFGPVTEYVPPTPLEVAARENPQSRQNAMALATTNAQHFEMMGDTEQTATWRTYYRALYALASSPEWPLVEQWPATPVLAA
ncbi:phage tail-collar fiber domain-containing protein [Aeromonas aquatica]|uniref:phage tail-collar fiber domain-containing protein n=1 Tax=Aeromonas aquatica TaxID=558964 RepID=UPI00286F400D|nr:phage tail protein [Aeromonas aquatica]